MPGNFPVNDDAPEEVPPAPLIVVDLNALESCHHCNTPYIPFSGSYGVCYSCASHNRENSTEFWEDCTDPDCLSQPGMVPHHTWVFADLFVEEVYLADDTWVCVCPICREVNNQENQ